MNRRNFLRGVLATAALSIYGPKAFKPEVETEKARWGQGTGKSTMIAEWRDLGNVSEMRTVHSGRDVGMADLRETLRLWEMVNRDLGVEVG